MSETFTYWGEELEYLDHPYNTTRLNERCVEVPIALNFQRYRQGSLLELGNVLSHYVPHWLTVGNVVVDKYEGPINMDVFDLVNPYQTIIAISTIEHVRWDEEPKTANGASDALRHLYSLLVPGGRMLVTVPFGWHPFLDSNILDGEFNNMIERQCSIERHGNRWIQTPWGVEHQRYAKTTIWAESVWVAEFQA